VTETTQAPPYASAKAWRRFSRKTVATATHTIWLGALADDGYGRHWAELHRMQQLSWPNKSW
jgi:hypothetical protein